MALALPDSPHWLVYSKFVSILKADPTLKRVVSRDSWKTFDECLEDSSEPVTDGEVPTISILPIALNARPETEATVLCPLGLNLTLTTESLRDAFNLWQAVFAVALSVTGSTSTRAKLREVWPSLYDVQLTRPAFTPNLAEKGPLSRGLWQAVGVITINLDIPKN